MHDDLRRALALVVAAPDVGPPSTAPPPLPTILADIHALLDLIDFSATKLALALRPPSPAAIPVLHGLAQHASALAHASAFLHDNLHGATLATLVSSHVCQVIDALRALVQPFLDDNPANDLLLHTATLHDLIANARSPSGTPPDNQTAVYCAWKSDKDSLDDNLHEFAHFIAQSESNDPLDDPDDGWDEVGFGLTPHMDVVELDRAKNVHQILRLTTLLHKRIFLDVLAHPSDAPLSAFDSLLRQSNLLLSASDDLVAALYPPQDPDHVCSEVVQLTAIITTLQIQLSVFLPIPNVPSVTNPLTTSPKKRGEKKWFDMCFHQILCLCSNLTVGSLAQKHI